jgi:hypothetical protein
MNCIIQRQKLGPGIVVIFASHLHILLGKPLILLRHRLELLILSSATIPYINLKHHNKDACIRLVAL